MVSSEAINRHDLFAVLPSDTTSSYTARGSRPAGLRPGTSAGCLPTRSGLAADGDRLPLLHLVPADPPGVAVGEDDNVARQVPHARVRIGIVRLERDPPGAVGDQSRA